MKTSLGKMCDEKRQIFQEKSRKRKISKTESTATSLLASSTSIAELVNILLASSSDNEEPEAELSKEVSVMIEQCLKCKRLKAHEDPLAWWRNNCATFPCLAEFVRTYLSCPAASVAS